MELNPSYQKPVYQKPAAESPLGVTLSLSGETLMLGEPLTLFCTVTNALPETLHTYMGMDMKGWLIYRLVNPAGQEVSPLPDPRVPSPGGLHTTGARVSPRSQFHWAIALSQRFAVHRPGLHHLSVRVHLPYAPDIQDGVVRPEQFEEVYGTVFRAEHEFPILVTAADPSRLRALAEAAADEIIQRLPSSGVWQIAALFSMPEKYALPSWKAVAHACNLSHSGVRQQVASELARLNSIAAADLLADMIWNPIPPRSPSESGHLYSYLHNMYFQSGQGLRTHIADMFMRRGLPLPESPLLVTD